MQQRVEVYTTTRKDSCGSGGVEVYTTTRKDSCGSGAAASGSLYHQTKGLPSARKVRAVAGDFEALNCLPALNLLRRKKLHLTTEPPISCRCC